jgi:hypothetical protein
MNSNRSFKSVFKSVLVGGSMIALTTLPSGCNGINNKVLSSEKAQEIVTNYVIEHDGSVSNIQGVVQNEGASQAVATIAVSDFKYTISNGRKVKYTGKAVAEFSRYTDGRWSMTNVTINPDDAFSARRFTITDQSPSSNATLWDSLTTNPGAALIPTAFLLVITSPLFFMYYLTQKKSSQKKQS